jgi:cytochrome oxidase Cu insertion factor (SCO1/SenC/PrrC family)
MRAVILLALVGLAAAAWFTAPASRPKSDAALRGGVEDATSPVQELGDLGAVPEFCLVSQTGDSVRLGELRGRPWIADFIFTSCASSCPMMTGQLQALEKALADEPRIRLVSFSVDPERDTPARLAEYAAEYGARPERWLFLTGEKAALRQLSIEGFHLPAGDATPEDVARGAEAVMHSTRFVLVDAQGHIRGYYDGGDEKAMESLGRHVRRLASDPAS